MRVAVVSPYSLDHPGGVQSHARELVARLNRAGDVAWLVAPGTEIDPAGAIVTRPVGPAWLVPANGSRAPVALGPAVIRRVRRALEGADLVHVHEPLVPLVSWAALGAEPTVLTFHADPSPVVRRLYRWAAPLLRSVVSRARSVTAVSEVAASAIRAFAPELHVIPNGIEVDSYRLPDAPRIPGRVVFLGRRDPRKGLEDLESAWPSIRRRLPGATLRVLGADGAGGDGVEYLGRVDEATKRRELAAAEVFCAPNRGGESFGITLVEGLAAGCAAVASDIPAFRAVAGPDGACWVQAGNPHALAEGVVAVLADPQLRTELVRTGAARVAAYDWSAIVPRYRRLYRAAVSERID